MVNQLNQMPGKKNFPEKVFLQPLSIIFGLITYIRNRLFDYDVIQSHEFEIPVISVGNINVGGTGKTPHIEYLVSILKNEFSIAVLSRGYKRDTKDFIIADTNSTVYEIGDEPRQIKQKFPDIEVAVCEKRVKGIKNLISNFKTLEIILLDDAYQHRYVKPGISVLLIDYNHPLYKDHLLPYGSLRESHHEIRRANIIIITKSPLEIKPIEKRIMIKNVHPFPYQSLYFTAFNYSQPNPVFENSGFATCFATLKNENYTVLLVTGIANPAPLVSFLNKQCITIIHIAYRDHHKYTIVDLKKIANKFDAIDSGKKIILTTEKDSVRLNDLPDIQLLFSRPIFYLSVDIQFLNNEKHLFDNQIIDYVKKNKRHGVLHSAKS